MKQRSFLRKNEEIAQRLRQMIQLPRTTAQVTGEKAQPPEETAQPLEIQETQDRLRLACIFTLTRLTYRK